VRAERMHIRQWVRQERQYADTKFDDQRALHDDEMRRHGVSDDGFWLRQIMQYVARAQVLGLDNPLGRQAMAKAYMTLGGCLESMVRVYGRLPAPGVPSGEIGEREELR
jgi:hypothetical protein